MLAGVSHCDDLIYLFSLPLLFPPWPDDHPDLAMSKKLIELWTNFAKYVTDMAMVYALDYEIW